MNTYFRQFGHALFCTSAALFILTFASTAAPIPARVSSQWGVNQGDTIDVLVIMNSPQPLGGVDFTVHFVDSVFHFVSVTQDSGLNHWEYFVSVVDTTAHTVRFASIADIPNGPIHPAAGDFYPNGIMARMRFAVGPAWVQPSTQLPFDFYWGYCQDNATSNRFGDTLMLLHKNTSFQGALLWDETNNQAFPEANRIPHIGVPDSCSSGSSGVQFTLELTNGVAANYYVCGDADGNGNVNISDAVFLISFIFMGGPAPDPIIAGDADCNFHLNISDAVTLIQFIFAGGAPPCSCAK